MKLELGLLLCFGLGCVKGVCQNVPMTVAVKEIPAVVVAILADCESAWRRQNSIWSAMYRTSRWFNAI